MEMRKWLSSGLSLILISQKELIIMSIQSMFVFPLNLFRVLIMMVPSKSSEDSKNSICSDKSYKIVSQAFMFLPSLPKKPW
jgi:hypothetical protein